MKIDCLECGARVAAADVDLPSRMAKCRACDAVFSLDAVAGAAATLRRPRVLAPRPEGLRVIEDAGEPGEPGYREAPETRGKLTIVRRWYQHMFLGLLFFCIAWDSFLVFWYANAIRAPGGFAALATIFPIAHVAVGVGLTYYVIAGLLNRTTITLDGRELSIRHAPVPWRGNRRIPRGEITQLYCEEVVSSGKNGASRTYWLSAVLSGNRKQRLASMSADQVRYVEEQLEERLGLPDAEVPGELRA
jgi:hypothetical protein